MVTMLEPWTNGQRQYVGLSADEKPTAADGVRNGDLFIEMDTGVWYLFDGSTGEWTSGSSSGGGDSVTYATVTFWNRSVDWTYSVEIRNADDTSTTYEVEQSRGEIPGSLAVQIPLTNGAYQLYLSDFEGISATSPIEVQGDISPVGETYNITGDGLIAATAAREV